MIDGVVRAGCKRVPLHPRIERPDRLESLRLFVGARNALDSGPDFDRDFGGSARRFVEQKTERRLRGHAWFEAITDQLCEPQDGVALARGAKPEFIRDSFLIKREDVGERGPAVEERDREIVRYRASLGCEGRGSADRTRRRARFPENRRAGTDTVTHFREAGPIFQRLWNHGRDPFAATAIVQRRRHYLPPPRSTVKRPCSGKFGSFSRRAISRRFIARNPFVRPLVSGKPWRWKVVT